MTKCHYNVLECLLTKIATSFEWDLHQAIGKVKFFVCDHIHGEVYRVSNINTVSELLNI